jgi:transposase-like protein
MGKKKTHEEYVKEVTQINPNIEVVEQYVGYHTPILHRCNVDNFEWKTSPCSVLQGNGCPKCAHESRVMLLTKSHDQYVQDLHNIYPYIDILERYIAARTKALHRCNICGHVWPVKPTQLLSGKGCPVCGGLTIGPAPEYKNSIWASEYRDFFSKYLTEEQMKQLTPHTAKKIKIKCPDCYRIKEVRTHDMSRRGFSCMCQDGQSYPNKFVFNVLCQLNLTITPEYSPKWANDKRYDDYIHEYNIIIENHGLQHYKNVISNARTLEEEQRNDKYKYDLAMNNAISQYIVLDCRRSDMDWIKQSIMSSSLPQILRFNEFDIDWIKAAEYASSNLKKCAAELFNDGYNINQIANILAKDSTSIRNWLKETTKIGWCNYTPHDSREPVYCVELNMEFISIKEASQITGVSNGSISRCCNHEQEFAVTRKDPNNKTHWMWKHDAIIEGFIDC